MQLPDFSVSNAAVVDGTHVRVYFTCPLEASASNRDPAKYTFTGAHTLTAVSCDGSGDYIDVQVNEMAPGINYTVHVSNTVRDVFERTLVNPKSYTFIGNGDSPIVLSATAIDSRTVRIVFSDAMTNGPALLDPANYTFTGDYDLVYPCDVVAQSITVAAPTVIDIRTSKMVPKSGYFIHVVNVFDWLGNIIIPRLGQKNFPSTFRPITMSALCYPAERKVRLSFDRELVHNAALLNPANYVFTGPSTFTGILVVYINWHTVDVYYENALNDGTYRVTVYGATDIVGRVPDPWCDEAILQLVGTGPSLVAVWYRTSIELWAAFDMDMADDAALADPANYVFTGPGLTAITVVTATLLSGLRTIKLVVTGMADLTPYLLTVHNLKDVHGNDLVVDNTTFNSGFYGAPRLDSVSVTNATKILVTFDSSMMNDADLIDPTNYTLNDFPRIASSSLVDFSHVTIVYSKVVTVATAETTTNYTVTGLMAPTVSNASLAIDGITLSLTFDAPLTMGESYTLLVENVLDTSGDVIDPAYDTLAINVPAEYTWAEQFPATSPTARQEHKMVYCSARNEVILFGGYDAVGSSAETWMWNGTTWAQKVIAGPSSRYEHAMAYDSVNDRIVLFGGIASPRSDQTWEYDGAASTWTLKAPGVKPGALESHSMVYDIARGEIMLFGGYPTTNNTWVYNVATTLWAPKAPAHKPAARYYHRMAYDEANNNTVLFGGSSGGDETWIWDGADWTQKFPVTSPPDRYWHAMTYNAVAGGVVLYGGTAWPDDNEIWIWDGTNWTEVVKVAFPPLRFAHDMTYDFTTGGVLLFGGYDTGWNYLGDTWIYGP